MADVYKKQAITYAEFLMSVILFEVVVSIVLVRKGHDERVL